MDNANDSGHYIRLYSDNSTVQNLYQISEYDLQSVKNDVNQFPLSSAK